MTIRRLLDHISGIPRYTELPEFRPLSTRALPRDSLVAIIAAHRFAFAPGEAMAYNNSAYVLLGLVIEQASGLPYAAYVARHLFARAGMPDSRYYSNTAVVPPRVRGYAVRDDALGNATLERAGVGEQVWTVSGDSAAGGHTA